MRGAVERRYQDHLAAMFAAESDDQRNIGTVEYYPPRGIRPPVRLPIDEPPVQELHQAIGPWLEPELRRELWAELLEEVQQELWDEFGAQPPSAA